MKKYLLLLCFLSTACVRHGKTYKFFIYADTRELDGRIYREVVHPDSIKADNDIQAFYWADRRYEKSWTQANTDKSFSDHDYYFKVFDPNGVELHKKLRPSLIDSLHQRMLHSDLSSRLPDDPCSRGGFNCPL